jgi:hypothetical protein
MPPGWTLAFTAALVVTPSPVSTIATVASASGSSSGSLTITVSISRWIASWRSFCVIV